MDDLKIIKKKYGENMMHLCRKLFSTILDNKPGLLSEIMLSHFYPNHLLYNDLKKYGLELNFRRYIYSFIEIQKKQETDKNKSPEELLKEAGYILYKCNTEDEVQSFKKYYRYDEALCTFNSNRLENYYVFFAVKDNIEEIKRENFTRPERQDEYGTSVISIQFTKDEEHILSIKNRYNHKVKNPDATFSNNLDNIIEGLTKSFEKYYGLKQKYIHHEFEIPGYVLSNDGKYYKYNYEHDNIYYCPNNIIIDNFDVKKYDERILVFEYFILDFQKKEIRLYDEWVDDSFQETIGKINNIIIEKQGKIKKIILKRDEKDDLIFELDDANRMISLIDTELLQADDNYLSNVKNIKKLYLPNLRIAGNNFLYSNEHLENYSLYNLEIIKNCFLHNDNNIEQLDFPNLREIGSDFMYKNRSLKKIYIPNVEKIENSFLFSNEFLEYINANKLKRVGKNFLDSNNSMYRIYFPKLEQIDESFMFKNKILETVILPNVKEIGSYFLGKNVSLKELVLPKVEIICNYFLLENDLLIRFYAPNLIEIGSDFLPSNTSLYEFYTPCLQKKGYRILPVNDNIKLNKGRIK